MQMQFEMTAHYLNKKTGGIVLVSEEEMSAAENDESIEDAPEWQEESIKIAKELLETDDYIPLPSQFDIHEYAMMEKFCLSLV